MTLRLSLHEARAVVNILAERLAGGAGDWGDAVGLDYIEAAKQLDRAERVKTRLAQALAKIEGR